MQKLNQVLEDFITLNGTKVSDKGLLENLGIELNKVILEDKDQLKGWALVGLVLQKSDLSTLAMSAYPKDMDDKSRTNLIQGLSGFCFIEHESSPTRLSLSSLNEIVRSPLLKNIISTLKIETYENKKERDLLKQKAQEINSDEKMESIMKKVKARNANIL